MLENSCNQRAFYNLNQIHFSFQYLECISKTLLPQKAGGNVIEAKLDPTHHAQRNKYIQVHFSTNPDSRTFMQLLKTNPTSGSNDFPESLTTRRGKSARQTAASTQPVV